MFIKIIKLNMNALFSDFLGKHYNHFQPVWLDPNTFADDLLFLASKNPRNA